MLMLTIDELAELTGYKSAKSQIAWLHSRGWRFELNRAGQPKVDREYYRRQMGNKTAEPAAYSGPGPNWDAI